MENPVFFMDFLMIGPPAHSGAEAVGREKAFARSGLDNFTYLEFEAQTAKSEITPFFSRSAHFDVTTANSQQENNPVLTVYSPSILQSIP
ncbi:MAG TPA: hypothetical protein VIU12_22115 [Chryseolinea sp.]